MTYAYDGLENYTLRHILSLIPPSYAVRKREGNE